jgi:uncharacterized protein (DUF2267 family)
MATRGADPNTTVEVLMDKENQAQRVVVAIQQHMRLWYTPQRAREIAAELLKAAEQIECKG